MFVLIRNGEVYTPEPAGKRDILLVGGKIARVGEVDEGKIAALGLEHEVIDASGCLVIPGFIDPHQHILGAGGEAGPGSRMPEIPFADIAGAGITTVVGLLGTDATTRHLTSLLARARALEYEGLTAYIYTGSFQVPPVTFTGSVRDDMVVIDKVIGVGEIAISDFRSSKPTLHELARLVSDVMVGSLMTGKAGVAHFHTGAGREHLGLLHALLGEYDIKPEHLYPTHITRGTELMDDAVALARKGAYVDTDTIEIDLGWWLKYYFEHGGPPDRLTVSSDAGAGTSKGVRSLYEGFASSVLKHKMRVEQVLPCFTSNSAAALKLANKGRIKEGVDGDILVVKKGELEITRVIARGRVLKRTR